MNEWMWSTYNLWTINTFVDATWANEATLKLLLDQNKFASGSFFPVKLFSKLNTLNAVLMKNWSPELQFVWSGRNANFHPASVCVQWTRKLLCNTFVATPPEYYIDGLKRGRREDRLSPIGCSSHRNCLVFTYQQNIKNLIPKTSLYRAFDQICMFHIQLIKVLVNFSPSLVTRRDSFVIWLNIH